MLKNSSILVTGGTGSFGREFVKSTLNKFNPRRIVVFSRDEMKQWEMQKDYLDDERVRFFIGDVRDKERLYRALENIDCVVHAAATKIVSTAEYNPFECVKTNVMGGMNLIEACIDRNIKRVVALSTDKASSPINLYGATKLASDKLFIASNSSYAQGHDTRLSVVRYGNVMGSRGSILPFFMSLPKGSVLPITDVKMTRFMMNLSEGVQLVWTALNDMKGGEIYVKKIPSIKVVEVARVISGQDKFEIIGIRPGEKIHEEMINPDESRNTYEYPSYFKILPAIYGWDKDPERIQNGLRVKPGFRYSSDLNKFWLTGKDIIDWINRNKDVIEKFQ